MSQDNLTGLLYELYHKGQEHGSASMMNMTLVMDRKDKEARELIKRIESLCKKQKK